MSSPKITAVFADNALVVSVSSETAPRLWRMDMSRFPSAFFDVAERGGKHALLFHPGSGAAAEEIAAFADGKSAASALSLVTGAFLRGQGGHHHRGWLGRLLGLLFKIFLSLVVVVIVLALVFGRAKPPVNMGDIAPPSPPQAGVPLPADEALGK